MYLLRVWGFEGITSCPSDRLQLDCNRSFQNSCVIKAAAGSCQWLGLGSPHVEHFGSFISVHLPTFTV